MIDITVLANIEFTASVFNNGDSKIWRIAPTP
jgi:hypothetical protein